MNKQEKIFFPIITTLKSDEICRLYNCIIVQVIVYPPHHTHTYFNTFNAYTITCTRIGSSMYSDYIKILIHYTTIDDLKQTISLELALHV